MKIKEVVQKIGLSIRTAVVLPFIVLFLLVAKIFLEDTEISED